MLKPLIKTTRWSIVNGFESWMVKDIRFSSLMAKNKLRQKLDGQEWTFS
jgi:hypothetical protein